MNHLLPVSQEEYQKLLQMASELVPFGIYAIEKHGYAELRNDKCQSMTRGFKVYANGG